ncbi:ATP synthase subunit I [Thiohalobacter thiocyanaticus]|uniref:ATP synthase subunit I n=1 Tax=Thiohalobacter thiocyanaticus TaxID=585455 RepID=A0A426QJM9_9GAMM|nr:ATP synthase subunit I [Thiohalobacter thiocyanaticus]RRQ21955.1 ATP synthase subunit I [Thiohalobacter thiocyanaticus]
MRKILILQLVILSLAAGTLVMVRPPEVAIAWLFGAGIALSNTALLAWRSHRLARRPATDVNRDLRAFFFSAIERLVIVIMLFVAGLGALELPPLPLLGAFIAGQLVLMISSFKTGLTTHGE